MHGVTSQKNVVGRCGKQNPYSKPVSILAQLWNCSLARNIP